MSEEIFDIVSGDDSRVIGQAPRSRCHGDPSLIHRAVRIHIFHPENGKLLLQKRSLSKKIQPGKWDAAVGGHISAGESIEKALFRELEEELGIRLSPEDLSPIPFYRIQVRNEVESENIHAFYLFHKGPFSIQEEELDKVEFFTEEDLREKMEKEKDIFTPLLQEELAEHLLGAFPLPR